MEIIVCPLSLASMVAKERAVSRAISLLDPYDSFPHLSPLACDLHLKIAIHDIDEVIRGLTHPEAHHVDQVLNYASDWDRAAPLLVHCWAGVSRSTASAFSIACALNPAASEQAIATSLRRASPTATPDLRIVALADQALSRGGRMVEAAASIGRGEPAERAATFAIPAFFPSGGSDAAS